MNHLETPQPYTCITEYLMGQSLNLEHFVKIFC